MHRKLLPVMFVVAVTLGGAGALLSLRAGAAPAAPGARIFLPSIQLDAAPDVRLPDLMITSVYFNMRGYRGGCVPEYGPLMIVACVRNQGQGEAGPFSLAVNGPDAATHGGLMRGAQVCLETNASYTSNPVTVVVDPSDAVEESDEANNIWTGRLPVPTPPVLCTATPTPSVTPAPAAAPTASPTVPCARANCGR